MPSLLALRITHTFVSSIPPVFRTRTYALVTSPIPCAMSKPRSQPRTAVLIFAGNGLPVARGVKDGVNVGVRVGVNVPMTIVGVFVGLGIVGVEVALGRGVCVGKFVAVGTMIGVQVSVALGVRIAACAVATAA